MSGQAAARQAGGILLVTALLTVALALLGASAPADWGGMAARLEALPWGGPLWWLLRAALGLAGSVF